MPDLRLVTFNTHYGVRPPTARGAPYDLGGALDGLAGADVLVIQEVWRPDGVNGIVDEFAAAHGYEMTYQLHVRATMRHFWPKIEPDGEGTVGIAVLSRLPARLVDEPAVGPTWRDPAPERRVLHLEVDVAGTAVQLVGVHLTSRLPYGPPIQLRRLARGLRRSWARPSSPATATSGARPRRCSCPVGGGRCAAAPGRRAGRTARSTTSSCAGAISADGRGGAARCRQ